MPHSKSREEASKLRKKSTLAIDDIVMNPKKIIPKGIDKNLIQNIEPVIEEMHIRVNSR